MDYHRHTDQRRSQRGFASSQSQQGTGMGSSNRNTHTAGRQPSAQPHARRRQGSEQFSSSVRPQIPGPTGNMPSHDRNGPTDVYTSRQSGITSNHGESAHSGRERSAPRQVYRHYTTRAAQDDPFLSDEHFYGMLNGRPDNNHLGRTYTHAQQQDIDEYYRRLMTPRPSAQSRTRAPDSPPPRLRMEAPRSADGSDFAAGDHADWDHEWSAFVNDYDAEPLLGEDYPDEYPSRFPPGSPYW